ncbi:MAG: hypothetical protein ABIA67_05465 [Candidatus Margulisiibacteriota bacterium]
MILEKIDHKLPFIRKDNFRILFPEIKDSSFNQNIKNWLKKGELIALKRGLYVFNDYWEKCPDKDGCLNYLSSIIYGPSYISKETALARHGMLAEAVYGLSSVTVKTTRTFSSSLGIFTYSNIKPVLYTGFGEQNYIGNKYYVASKSKALFDYLYFYKRKISQVNRKCVEEFRLKFELMQKEDWAEYVKYLKLADSRKMDKLYHLIREEYAS